MKTIEDIQSRRPARLRSIPLGQRPWRLELFLLNRQREQMERQALQARRKLAAALEQIAAVQREMTMIERGAAAQAGREPRATAAGGSAMTWGY